MRGKRRKILGSTKTKGITHCLMNNRESWRIGRIRSLDSGFCFVLIIKVIYDCKKKVKDCIIEMYKLECECLL